MNHLCPLAELHVRVHQRPVAMAWEVTMPKIHVMLFGRQLFIGPHTHRKWYFHKSPVQFQCMLWIFSERFSTHAVNTGVLITQPRKVNWLSAIGSDTMDFQQYSGNNVEVGVEFLVVKALLALQQDSNLCLMATQPAMPCCKRLSPLHSELHCPGRLVQITLVFVHL